MSSVTERRLRLVYDLLDCGNSKKALQEAERLLKKQPNFICAKALRALALLRLDRADECRAIVQAVVTELPTDDNSLQVLTICYKELHEPERICDLYEAVNRKEPGNEEFLSHLFMSYVRVRNYKKQQQTAMALYKAWPKNPYYFWAVMSVLMQASETSPDSLMPNKLSLQLAERLLEKFVKQNKMEAEAEVQLYLMVLEQQGNYEAALEVLNGRLANLLRMPNLVRSKRALYLEKLGRWRDLALLTQELIRQDPSQWSYYQTHLRAVFAVVDQQPTSAQSGSDVIAANDVTPADNAAHTTGINAENARLPSLENMGRAENHVDDEKSMSENHVCNHVAESRANDVNGKGDTSRKSPNKEQIAPSSESAPSDGKKSDVASVSPPASGDVSAAATAEFLARLRDTADGRERAPALAMLSLARELQQRHLPHPLPFEPVDAVVSYVAIYGDRACCFCDVEPALELVPADRVADMLDTCRALVEVDERGVPVSIPHLQRHLTWLQLRHRYSSSCRDQLQPSAAQQGGSCRIERAAELMHYHSGTAPLSEGLLDTELRPNDLYILLAVYGLYDEWTDTKQVVHLLHALILLEHGISLSPSNFHLKLCAIHVYHLLGAAGAAFSVYNTLDLKSIQLDTLSYVCSRRIAAQGHLASAQLVFNTVLRFFNNAKDTSDCLIAAYKVGSFPQIPEFTALRERLTNSTNHLLTMIDGLLLDLTMVASQHAQTLELMKYTPVQPHAVSPIAWEKQRDNRDTSTLPAFSAAERCEREVAAGLSWLQDLRLLLLRQLALRALMAVLEMPAPGADSPTGDKPAPGAAAKLTAGGGKSPTEGGKVPPVDGKPPSTGGESSPVAAGESRGAVLRGIADEITAALQSHDATPPEPAVARTLSMPLPSRLPQLLESCQLQLLRLLLAAAAEVADGRTPTEQAAQVEALCAQICSRERVPDATRPAATLEEAALLTETVSLAVVICGAMHAWAAPAKPVGKKGKKKRQAEQESKNDEESAHNRIVYALMNVARSACTLVAAAGTELHAVTNNFWTQQLRLDDPSSETEQNANAENGAGGADAVKHTGGTNGAEASPKDSAGAADSPLRQRAARVLVLTNLDNSYNTSVSELESVLQYKMDYLAACMFL